MGSKTAYACDGPGCEVLTVRAPGTQYPSSWDRVSYRKAGQPAATGAFHSGACAARWLAEQMGVIVPAADEAPPKPKL